MVIGVFSGVVKLGATAPRIGGSLVVSVTAVAVNVCVGLLPRPSSAVTVMVEVLLLVAAPVVLSTSTASVVSCTIWALVMVTFVVGLLLAPVGTLSMAVST